MILLAGESFSLCELFKIPKLFSHFVEHNEQNASIDFSTFLSMHYWGDDEDDDDDDQDMQLPFKRMDHHTSALLFVSAKKKLSIKPPYLPLKSDRFFDRDESGHNAVLESLFRPPRV